MPHPCTACGGRVATPRNPRVSREWCGRCWRSVPLVWRKANARMWAKARAVAFPGEPLPHAMRTRWHRLTRRIALAIIERRGL